MPVPIHYNTEAEATAASVAAAAERAAAEATVPTPQEITAAAEADLRAAEEENITNANNITGDHEPADDSMPPPPQRVSVREPGSRSNRNRPPIDASRCPNTRAVIALYRDKGTLEDPMPSDDELRIRMQQELKELAGDDENAFHKDLWSKSHTQCTCLHELLSGDNGNIRAVVSNAVVELMKSSKDTEDREIGNWIRYATKSKSRGNRQEYLVPFSTVYQGTDDLVADLSSEELRVLNNHTLCTSGIALLMQRGKKYWARVKKEVMEFGKPKPHGLKGKKKAMSPELFDDIKDFWDGVQNLAEIRATKVVRTVAGLETQGDADGVVHLPQYFSIRNLYGRYLDDLGYDMKQYGNGSYQVSWREVEGGSRKPYVQMTTFYNVWQQHFGHIKVSSRIEDICVLCYQFANRHKYMKGLGSCNSNADASLFICQDIGDQSEEDADGGSGGGDGDTTIEAEEEDEPPPLTQRDNETDDEPIAEEPTAESTTATQEPSFAAEEDLMDVMNGGDFHDREEMIIRGYRHVKMAQVQRLLYVTLVHKARQHVRLKLPFTSRSFTFVVDFGQNMELPVYNKEQPGCSYYYSPLGIYNLGMVDQAYAGPNDDEYDNPRDHMHLHLYHEGIGKKGANNVCSLIWKTLALKNLLKPNGETGGELNIIFDNCTGQNKNNAVLKMMVWLTEMGYFKQVNFIFLVVGHTKNAADRLFNLVKMQYRKDNLFTFSELKNACQRSNHVSVHEAKTNDFKDWDSYLGHFYSDFSGRIKHNHKFSCNYENNQVGNKLMAHLEESDLPEDAVYQHNTIKQTFLGRKLLFSGKSFADAVAARRDIMQKAKDGDLMDGEEAVGKLEVIQNDGINIFKQVELATKYKKIVPIEFRNDELYKDPSPEVIAAVKKEKAMRKSAREEINAEKMKVQRKRKLESLKLELNPEGKGGYS